MQYIEYYIHVHVAASIQTGHHMQYIEYYIAASIQTGHSMQLKEMTSLLYTQWPVHTKHTCMCIIWNACYIRICT